MCVGVLCVSVDDNLAVEHCAAFAQQQTFVALPAFALGRMVQHIHMYIILTAKVDSKQAVQFAFRVTPVHFDFYIAAYPRAVELQIECGVAAAFVLLNLYVRQMAGVVTLSNQPLVLQVCVWMQNDFLDDVL